MKNPSKTPYAQTTFLRRPATFVAALLAAPGLAVVTALAQGTAFIYHTRLDGGDAPASGICDLRSAIYDSTNAPAELLHIVGDILASSTITPNSDRNAKTDFAAVIANTVLKAVVRPPIQQWRFKTEAPGVKHIVPMSQDFRAAFGVGPDDPHVAMVDAAGVALAAIPGVKPVGGTTASRLRTEGNRNHGPEPATGKA